MSLISYPGPELASHVSSETVHHGCAVFGLDSLILWLFCPSNAVV